MTALSEGPIDQPELQFNIVPIANCDNTRVTLEQLGTIHQATSEAISVLLSLQKTAGHTLCEDEILNLTNADLPPDKKITHMVMYDVDSQIKQIQRIRELTNQRPFVERVAHGYRMLPGNIIKIMTGREIDEFQALADWGGLDFQETVTRCLAGLPVMDQVELSLFPGSLPKPLVRPLSVINVELPDFVAPPEPSAPIPAPPMTDVAKVDFTAEVLSQPLTAAVTPIPSPKPAPPRVITPKPAPPRAAPKPAATPQREARPSPPPLPPLAIHRIHPRSLIRLAGENGETAFYRTLYNRDLQCMHKPDEQRKLQNDLKRYVYEGIAASYDRDLPQEERAQKTQRLAGAIRIILDQRSEQGNRSILHYEKWCLLSKNELRQIASESIISIFARQAHDSQTIITPPLLAAAVRSGIIEALLQKEISGRGWVTTNKRMHQIAAAVQELQHDGQKPTLEAVASHLEMPQELVLLLHVTHKRLLEHKAGSEA